MNRVLAIDYGDKRIGLALSDPLKIIAKPFDVIINTSQDEVFRVFDDIIAKQKVDTLVIGMPKNMNGSVGFQGQKVKDFFENYTNSNISKIIYIDERRSSEEAKKILKEQGLTDKKQRGILDAYAASIILKEYLEYGV